VAVFEIKVTTNTTKFTNCWNYRAEKFSRRKHTDTKASLSIVLFLCVFLMVVRLMLMLVNGSCTATLCTVIFFTVLFLSVFCLFLCCDMGGPCCPMQINGWMDWVKCLNEKLEMWRSCRFSTNIINHTTR